MATNAELEQKVKALEKSFSEMVEAIRGLNKEQNESMKIVSKVNDEMQKIKLALHRVQQGSKIDYGTNVGR